MARDRLKHLELHGKSYRYVRFVGSRSIRIPLGTTDLQDALARRDALDAKYDGHAPKHYELERRISKNPNRASIFRLLGVEDETARAVAVDQHFPLISIDIAKWTCDVSPAYAVRCKRAFTLLTEFLRSRNHPQTLEAVSRQVALDFTAWREEMGDGPSSLAVIVSALRGLWAHAGDRRADLENPWRLVKVKGRKGRLSERPFTPEEARTILTAFPEGTPIGDACRIAALTGMRLSEIQRLTTADIVDDVISIGKSKTVSGIRRVPVSTSLKPLIMRLSSGGKVGQTLIPPGSNISDRFGRKLRALNLAEVHKGSQRSRINFHSWRRCAAMQLEQTGVSELVSARLLGHKIRTLSYGVYNAAGASLSQLREAVEALRLP